MEINAPHDGILVLQRNWRGELPQASASSCGRASRSREIPLLDAMEAEVFVLEVDGSGLAEKQPAEIVDRGAARASPTRARSGSSTSSRSRASPACRCSTSRSCVALDKTDHDVMKPGQRVRATLILDQADALVVPRQAVFDKDGKNVVYRRRRARASSRSPVELGAGDLGPRRRSRRASRAGDVIALRDPTRSVDQAIGSGSAQRRRSADRAQAMRRLLDAFVAALESLAEHKLRTTLTMLGMMFGVGAVIAMLSIGAGAEKQALALIDRLGTRNVVVRGKTFKPEELEEIRKKSLGLSQRDVEAIEEAVPGVAVRGAAHRDRAVQDPRRRREDQGAGLRRRPSPSRGHAVRARRGPLPRRARRAAPRAGRVIGAGVRRDLFGADPALGRDVKINDVWFEVDRRARARARRRSRRCRASRSRRPSTRSTCRSRPRCASSIAIRSRRRSARSSCGSTPKAPAAETGAVVGTLLDRLHGGARDYDIIVPEALLQHSQQTQQLFNLGNDDVVVARAAVQAIEQRADDRAGLARRRFGRRDARRSRRAVTSSDRDRACAAPS